MFYQINTTSIACIDFKEATIVSAYNEGKLRNDDYAFNSKIDYSCIDFVNKIRDLAKDKVGYTIDGYNKVANFYESLAPFALSVIEGSLRKFGSGETTFMPLIVDIKEISKEEYANQATTSLENDLGYAYSELTSLLREVEKNQYRLVESKKRLARQENLIQSIEDHIDKLES